MFVMIVLLPFTASAGPAYESYMEVATLVGIYVAMALGLNVVVGFTGLFRLGLRRFLCGWCLYIRYFFATGQAQNFYAVWRIPAFRRKLFGCFL
ncbi:hypothetical protein GCM10020331_050380 [Ectobacillus funiculus]